MPAQLITTDAEPSTCGTFKGLHKVLKHLNATGSTGLRYTALDLTTTRLLPFTDSSFAYTKGNMIQFRFFILMTYNEGRRTTVSYGSSRCRCVPCPVLATELHALLLVVDDSFATCEMLNTTLARTVPIEALVDSITVVDLIFSDGKTSDRRLQIDVSVKREL